MNVVMGSMAAMGHYSVCGSLLQSTVDSLGFADVFGHGEGMKIYVNDGKPIGAKVLCIMCDFHKNRKEWRLGVTLAWAIQK